MEENEIRVVRYDNYNKIIIPNPIPFIEYTHQIKEIENSDVLKKISGNVLWNEKENNIVNEGIYYTYHSDGSLFNLLIGNGYKMIDSRTKINMYTEENILTINNNGKFSYAKYKIDDYSNVYTGGKYIRLFDILGVGLTKEEVIDDLKYFKENIQSQINDIENYESDIDNVLSQLNTIKRVRKM